MGQEEGKGQKSILKKKRKCALLALFSQAEPWSWGWRGKSAKPGAGSGDVAQGRGRAGTVSEVRTENDVSGDGGSDYDQEISLLKPP